VLKKEIQHIQLICNSGSAHTIFRSMTRESREIVFEKYMVPFMLMPGDAHEKEITVDDHSTFCKKLDTTNMSTAYLDTYYPEGKGKNSDRKKQTEKMREFINRQYFQEIWTGMHQEMFGANRYRAFQLELEYLKHHIVKPYEGSVRKLMQRVDVLLTYLPFFPPRTVRSERPTDKEWAAFNVTKQVDDKIKRDIQYNMLPTSSVMPSMSGKQTTKLWIILGSFFAWKSLKQRMPKNARKGTITKRSSKERVKVIVLGYPILLTTARIIKISTTRGTIAAIKRPIILAKLASATCVRWQELPLLCMKHIMLGTARRKSSTKKASKWRRWQ